MNEKLRARYDQKVDLWEDRSEPIFRAWTDDGRCYMLPMTSFVGGVFNAEEQTAELAFQMGALQVIGPKAWEFCSAFCPHKATLLKADGMEIISVTMTLAEKEE